MVYHRVIEKSVIWTLVQAHHKLIGEPDFEELDAAAVQRTDSYVFQFFPEFNLNHKPQKVLLARLVSE